MPSLGFGAEGTYIRVESAFRPLASTSLGELVVWVRPLHPLASTHPALLTAVRRACEEVINEFGGTNSGTVQAARARLDAASERGSRLDDDALDLQWIEIQQEGPQPGPIVQRRSTGAERRVVFPAVLRDAATRLRRPTERGFFRAPESAWTEDAELLISEAPAGSEMYMQRRGGILRAAARLDRRGEAARLVVEARGEKWSSASVGWRFGTQRGLLALEPKLQAGQFSGSVVLRTPFAEARRCDPMFDVRPVVLIHPVVRVRAGIWQVEEHASASRWRVSIPLAKAACVRRGVDPPPRGRAGELIHHGCAGGDRDGVFGTAAPTAARAGGDRAGEGQWRVKVESDGPAPRRSV